MWVPFADLFKIPPYEFHLLTYAQFCALEAAALHARSSDG